MLILFFGLKVYNIILIGNRKIGYIKVEYELKIFNN